MVPSQDRRRCPSPAALQVILLGDSLTAGMPGVGYMEYLLPLVPGCRFVNEGVCGDTVDGLHERVRRMRHPRADLALVWIGTNDACRFDPGGELMDWFGREYDSLLADVVAMTERVLTVPPLVIGLEPLDYWTKLLEEMARVIRTVTGRHPAAGFLDLRAEFARLSGVGPERWSQFTEDGAHLDSAGARLVARIFADRIGRLRQGPAESRR